LNERDLATVEARRHRNRCLVLGAIGGALVSAFQLIYVHYRSDMLGIEERLDARLSQIDRAFTEDLATSRP